MMLTLQWTATPVPGRTLFMVFGYHGRDADSQSSFWTWGESANARSHRIVHRDHYANPRTPAYQLAMIAAATDRLSPDYTPDAVLDIALGESFATEIAGGFGTVEIADLTRPRFWRHGLATRTAHYDNVVLVFADALGLGCEAAEHRVLRDRAEVLAINGRRRVFAIDQSFSRTLAWHRWLAGTRVVERGLAAGVRPFAFALSLVDRVSGVA